MRPAIMRDYLESKVAETRQKVREFQRQLWGAEAELNAYEDMLAHLPTADSRTRPHNQNGARHPLDDILRQPGIPTEMTPGWRAVLTEVGESGKSFSASDIAHAAEVAGVPAKMTNARSQIYQWDRKHIITRVRAGRYRLTEKGIDLIKKIEGPEAVASEPSTKTRSEGEFLES
jgi:hypothetical protein